MATFGDLRDYSLDVLIDVACQHFALLSCRCVLIELSIALPRCLILEADNVQLVILRFDTTLT